MSWITNIFKKRKPSENAVLKTAVSMKGYQPNFTAFGSNILYSDIVLSALKMKARFFGKLDPRHVRIRNDKTELITDSSVARILRNPNDFQTPYDFLTQAYFMREKDDNCFIYPDYKFDGYGNKVFLGMYVLLPTGTPVVKEDEKGKLFIQFRFANPDRDVLFPMEDIIVWRNNMEDSQFLGGGKFGGQANGDLLNSLSAYHTAKEAIAEASQLGCYIDGIIKVNAYASDTEKTQRIRNEFIDDLRNNKSHIGVLDNGADYVNIQRQLKMADSATLAEIKQNVLLHTGVSIDMLMGKFSTAEKEAFFENHIEPASVSLGQAMSKVFFSTRQATFGDCVLLYPSKIQLMSTSEITSVVQTTISAGVFTIDEYRAMYGFAPLPNGEGEQRPRGYNHLDGNGNDATLENQEGTNGGLVDGNGKEGN